MKRFFQAVALCALVLSMNSCADENILTNEIGSQLQTEGMFRVSTFHMSNKFMEVPEGTREIDITLQDRSSRRLVFRTKVKISGDRLDCSIMIPEGSSIPDGGYSLNAHMLDGTSLGARMEVLFKNEMLYLVEEERVAYTSLQGDGTAENPYLICSQSDFNKLLYNLDRDEKYRGKGLYFLQKGSFKAPAVSNVTDGRGYGSESFAGIYDGGNNSITDLNYIGSSNPDKDSHVGLFNELLDGASVSNLSLTQVNLKNVHEYCGTLAGAASGNVTVSNVKVSGTIDGECRHVGGLVGYLNGKLTVNRFDFGVTISGGANVGGIVGFVDAGGELDVAGVTTRSHSFTVFGLENVGGLAGCIDGKLNASDVKFVHTVDNEDSDLRIIYASKGYCGGLAGRASFTGESRLENISIQCPVESGLNYAGGLAGYIRTDSGLLISDVKCSSFVRAKEYAGGFVGRCDAGSEPVDFVGENKFAVEDEAATGVSAEKYAGGIFGGFSGSITISDILTVSANLEGNDRIGGVAGTLSDCEFDIWKISISPTIHIKGKNDVGGLFGYVAHSEICGPNTFDYAVDGVIRVPKKSGFKSQFNGEVIGENNVGGLAGRIERTEVKAVSVNASVNGSDGVGGLVGVAEYDKDSKKRFEDCTFMGTVKGSHQTGGVVGKVVNGGYIIDCVNYGTVDGSGKTGGVIGKIDYTQKAAQVYYCVNTGKVSGGSMVGGVVGYMDGDSEYIKVHHCANYGYITASGSSGAGLGGIVGGCEGTKVRVMNNANHGEIMGTGAHHGIGGIAGTLGNDPGGVHQAANLELGYCCNKGEVHSSNPDSPIGGILGYQEEGGADESDHDSWLHDCYNCGDISSDQDPDTGGILGKADHYATIVYCINFGEVSHGNAVVGTRKSSCIFYHHDNYYLDGTGKSWSSGDSFSEKDRTNQNTFDGFDFKEVWTMGSKGPILRNCPFQDISYSE